jgi:hypothetical protein
LKELVGFAELGNGHIQIGESDQVAADFLRNADLPDELRADSGFKGLGVAAPPFTSGQTARKSSPARQVAGLSWPAALAQAIDIWLAGFFTRSYYQAWIVEYLGFRA